MDTEKRMAGDYEIIHAVQIGDNEVVVGENQKDIDGQKYMVANCETNELFARYNEVLVSDDYPEIMKIFGRRITEQAEKVKNELLREDVDMTPVTADKCELDSYDKYIEGKVIVIRAESSSTGISGFHPADSALHRRLRRTGKQPCFVPTFIMARSPDLSAGMYWAR